MQQEHSNLIMRIISILVLAPIVLWAIMGQCANGETNVAFAVLVAVIGAVMSWEWSKMVAGESASVAATLTVMSSSVAFLTKDHPALSLGLIAFTALFSYLVFGRRILTAFGAFYIGIPLLSFVYIAYYSGSGESDLAYSPIYVLWVLFVVWATDVGGYMFGKSIGGPKLMPRISPKKTWAGLFGGVVFAAAVTYIFVLQMNNRNVGLSMPYFVISSIILAFIAQAGDLFESAIKRSLKIKDSSNLIPGHGGIFDRVDGLLFVAPVVALFVHLSLMGWLEM